VAQSVGQRVSGATDAIPARAWHTLFITSVSMFLVAMDVTIVSVALPGITKTFSGTPPSSLAWVFTAYNITFAALLLLAGKLGDRWGRKRSFMWGLVLFAVASLFAALAPSSEVLIGARVLQAAGSALIYPASLALLLPEFPLERRSMAIGVWGGIAGLGGAVAPTVGAMLVQAAGWRAVFFINLPFVVAALIAGSFVLREMRIDDGESFDAISVPLGAVAIGLLVLGVVQGEPWGWTDPKTIASFLGAALLLPVFFIRSARHSRPLLDLNLFRIRSFSVANVAQVLFTGSTFGWLVLMPSFFIEVWGWSPLAAGFGLAPAAAISALLSPVAGRLADRIGHRWLVAIGCVLGAAGTAWWVVMVTDTSDYPRDVLPGMVLAGLGTTAGFATLTGALMSRVPPRYYSMGGAARSTLFQLGTAIGIAVAVALVDAGGSSNVRPYEVVWVIATICAILAAIVMVALFPRTSIQAETVHPESIPVAATH
jgi:EmrB/QacA subfamily drug resistance transporter